MIFHDDHVAEAFVVLLGHVTLGLSGGFDSFEEVCGRVAFAASAVRCLTG